MKKIIGSMLLSIGLLSAGVVSNITQIGDTVEDRIENTASMTQMDAVGGQPYTMPTSTSTATSETTIDLNLGSGGGDIGGIASGIDFSDTAISFTIDVPTCNSNYSSCWTERHTYSLTGGLNYLIWRDNGTTVVKFTYSPASNFWNTSNAAYSMSTGSNSSVLFVKNGKLFVAPGNYYQYLAVYYSMAVPVSIDLIRSIVSGNIDGVSQTVDKILLGTVSKYKTLTGSAYYPNVSGSINTQNNEICYQTRFTTSAYAFSTYSISVYSTPRMIGDISSARFSKCTGVKYRFVY